MRLRAEQARGEQCPPGSLLGGAAPQGAHGYLAFSVEKVRFCLGSQPGRLAQAD